MCQIVKKNPLKMTNRKNGRPKFPVIQMAQHLVLR